MKDTHVPLVYKDPKTLLCKTYDILSSLFLRLQKLILTTIFFLKQLFLFYLLKF